MTEQETLLTARIKALESEKNEILADFAEYHKMIGVVGNLTNGNVSSLPKLMMQVMSNPKIVTNIGEVMEKINTKYNFNND
jgi:hypothetical protein